MRSRTPFVLSVGLLIGALLTGMAVNTSAAVPQLINFQGILVDGGGNPVTTTTSVLFTIWNRAMSGIPVWSETQSITPGADGSFTRRRSLGTRGSIAPRDARHKRLELQYLDLFR